MSSLGNFDSLKIRVRMLFGRRAATAQLEHELEFHLDQQIKENIGAGMDPEQARLAALRLFGNPTAVRDKAHETWSWNWLEVLALDVRQGVRALVHTPSFSVVAIVVLALGIGANVALFSVVHSVLLKALPFPEPDRLVRVYEAEADGKYRDNVVAGGSFGSWKAQAKSFSDLAIKDHTGYNLAGGGGQLPEFIQAETGSWNLFPLLGVRPALGRLFLADDDRPGANATVVLTWGLWKRRYGGDPAILGKSILLDARPYTVVGVLPAWFTYPDAKVQLWTPLYHERSPGTMLSHDTHNFDVVGRMKSGVTMAEASAEINGIQRQLRRQYPDGPVYDGADLRPILDGETRTVKLGLYALLAATGCLLLIACLNIANLVIARAATRRRETAIRSALGGSRFRLIRAQIIETLLLSAAGGVTGLGMAYGALQWLVSTRTDIPRAESIHIDGVALLFTVCAVLVCGLLAGFIPVLSFRDRHILRALQESSRAHSGGGGGVRLRRLLLAVEVGLTVVLLIGASLLLKTYQQLRTVNPGCAIHNVLTMDLTLPKGAYTTAAKRVSFFEQLLLKTRQLPGVEAAGLATLLPGQGHQRDDIFFIPEHPPVPRGQFLDASTIFVDPGYFAAMQIPLVRGRFLDPDERFDRAISVDVNEALVREYFPGGEDPIGKHIVSPVSDDLKTYRIVGVVGDTHEYLSDPPRSAIFFPLYLGSERSATLTVRATSNPMSLALPVQRVIGGIDPDLPVKNVLTMDQVLGAATVEASFDAVLLLAFAAISLVLAAVGLFGVLSFMVNQRTAEIGIRIALGAERTQVTQMVLADGLQPAVVGLVLGLGASALLTPLVRSMLYGTKPLDPSILVFVSVTLMAVATLACLVPAWRASHLDPVQALRSE